MKDKKEIEIVQTTEESSASINDFFDTIFSPAGVFLTEIMAAYYAAQVFIEEGKVFSLLMIPKLLFAFGCVFMGVFVGLFLIYFIIAGLLQKFVSEKNLSFVVGIVLPFLAFWFFIS